MSHRLMRPHRLAALLVLVAIGCAEPGTGPCCPRSDVGVPAAASYYAAPGGSDSGDGSAAHPWSLAAALAGGNGLVRPGDTVWLRGGTYRELQLRSRLQGAPDRPIIVRQYPGEHATLDGSLRVDSGDVWFWGFEIMRSAPSGDLPGLEARGPRTKYINLVVHDAAGQGITFWDEAQDAEVYGCIVYNNGTHRNLDHGIYVHNPTGTKLVRDNVFFQNLAYGIHVFAAANNPPQVGVSLVGNVAFDNGTIDSAYAARGNILLGGAANVPFSGMQVVDNYLYFYLETEGENLRVGFDSAAQNGDVVVRGNYVRGGWTVFNIEKWSRAVVDSNTFAGSVTSRLVRVAAQPLIGYQWQSNTHLRDPAARAWGYNRRAYSWRGWRLLTGLGGTDVASATAPAAARVFVRPNRYEPGRAHVVIFNWTGSGGDVPVDLSAVLQPGDAYVVRNVQDVFGAPVRSGVYAGGPVGFPMGGVTPPAPLGRQTPLPPPTAPAFDVFLVTKGSS